jgi:hypothetical protein
MTLTEMPPPGGFPFRRTLQPHGQRSWDSRSAAFLWSDTPPRIGQLIFRHHVDNKQHFSLWYIVSVVLFLFAVQSFLGDPHVQVLTYSDFQALLQAVS